MDIVTPLAEAARTTFRVGSRLRSARFFHPRGLVLAGELRASGEGPLPVGRTACLVRISKAIGTPGDLPDILGLALRYEDSQDVGQRPVDILVASSVGTHGWQRSTLWPAAAWGTARFTSLLAWESDAGVRARVTVEVDDPRLTTPDVHDVADLLPIVLRVRVDGPDGVLQRAELELTGPELAPVDFDPVLHEPPGWRFVPRWVARVRVASYAGSRAGRPDTVSPSAASR